MNRTELTIREMAAGDLERVIALDAEVGGLRRDDFFRRRWRAMNDSPQSYLALVAADGDAVGGFVMGHILTGEFGETRPLAVIDSMGVEPGKRGSGLGRALMESLKTAARTRECTEIRTLSDWTRQDLLGFFHATGFSPAPLNVLEKNLETH